MFGPILNLSPFFNVCLVTLIFLILELISLFIWISIPGGFFFRQTGWFKCCTFEDGGKFWKKLKVDKWKRLLPDGSVWLGRTPKNKLQNFKPEYLRKILIEMSRGEMVHLWQIPAVFIFLLFTPWWIALLYLFVTLLCNVPPVISQRYNRPRLWKYYIKITEK